MNYDFNTGIKKIQPKDAWELLIYPYGIHHDGEIDTWAFCLWDYFIINEQWTNGTQKCLSHWFKEITGKNATHESYALMTLSKTPTEKTFTTWINTEKSMNKQIHDSLHPCTSKYMDTTTNQKLWICELWWHMWGTLPHEIHMGIEPIN